MSKNNQNVRAIDCNYELRFMKNNYHPSRPQKWYVSLLIFFIRGYNQIVKIFSSGNYDC
jgi:hypothetical protein